MTSIEIYLRNHEAAAQAGRDLFRRAARVQQAQPWAPDLRTLTSDVEADLRSLRHIMATMTISPDLLAGLTMRLGERVGRLKLNGRLLTRSPLSDLVEVEGLLDAVRAKQAGWQALDAAQLVPARLEPLLQDLLERANDQATRLLPIHQRVAKVALRR